MLQIRCGQNQNGAPAIAFEIQEVAEPLQVLRALKKAFPVLWQQVHLELIVPANGVDVSKLEALKRVNP